MIEGQFKPFQRLQFEPLEQLIVGGVEITFFASANSTGSTVTWPASVASGDIAVLIDHALNIIGTPGDVAASGFTNIAAATYSDSFKRIKSYWKICTGSETGSLSCVNGNQQNGKVLLVFRPTGGTITTVTPTDAFIESQDGDIPAQVVNASGGATPLIVIGATIGQATTAFTTASPAFDATVATSSTRLIVGYKMYNSSPADHTIDMNDVGGGNGLLSFYLKLS